MQESKKKVREVVSLVKMVENLQTESSPLCVLGKNFSRQHFETFFFFTPKIGFEILSKLSPQERTGMKYQSLFSGKNLSSAELGQIVVQVKKKFLQIMWCFTYLSTLFKVT